MNHNGFVAVDAAKPAHDALRICTTGESAGKCLKMDETIIIIYNLLTFKFHYCNVFRNAFDCEYAQKYIALDGATPTIFGPRPLNSAREPSVCTINLDHTHKKLNTRCFINSFHIFKLP